MARGRRAGRVRPDSPQRRCVGCREQKPAATLLRIAARDGVAVADPGHEVQGRGCWLCRDPRCAETASKGRQIARALKGRASDPGLRQILLWLEADAGSPVA